MLHSGHTATDQHESDDVAVGAIAERGATGALVVAAIASAIVVVLWFAFYLLVFVPRAPAP
jgi:hypothetical protein